MLKLTNLCFGYARDALIFDNFSFQTEEKKIGLIGPNGSGKTTLLKLIHGELVPRAGRIERDDSSYYLISEWDHLLKLTLNQVLELARPLASFNLEALDQHLIGLGLVGYREVPLVTLSKGTLKKVGLLFLMLSTANLLLMDEPFTAIDRRSVDYLSHFIQQSNKEFIIVDHQIDLVENITNVMIDLTGKSVRS